MKTSRRLYGDRAQIEELLGKMQLMETAAGNWAAVYKDKVTGAFWMKYHTMSGMQGGGFVQLIKLPLPLTEELINIAILSPFEDEAVAAILRLVDEEIVEKKNFRHLLVGQLEKQNMSSFSTGQKQRMQKIITLAALNDPMNKREVLNKSAEQVQKDAVYYRTVAERAQLLLKELL